MRRAERLFQIIQILRSANAPVTGKDLAEELEISLRSLYRDMAELAAQRIPITGEAGVGYVLDKGYNMPPLMLTADELEAAALGAAWVAAQEDITLARAARDLVAKLSLAVPKELRPIILNASSTSISTHPTVPEQVDTSRIRMAIRERRRLKLTYIDNNSDASCRIVWPILIAYLDRSRYLVAWCEMRQDYRHFRTDRIEALDVLSDKYRERRALLIKNWQGSIAHKQP